MENETGECKSCEKLVDKIAALEQRVKELADQLRDATKMIDELKVENARPRMELKEGE